MSFKLEHPGAKVVATRDGGDFGEIDLRIVFELKARPTESHDLTAGCEMRMAGIPFKRRNGGRIGPDTEFHSSHPGKWAEVEQLGIDQAEQKASIVAPAEKRVVHLQRGIAGREIDRDGLIVPEDLAVAELEMVDGKGEELFDRGLAGGRSTFLPQGKIGGAVGMENHVDDGLFQDHFLKTKFGAEKKIELQAGDDA